MKPKQLNDLLLEKNISYQNIADELEIGASSVGRVINKGFSSRAIKLKVCEMLGLIYNDVWPSRERRHDIGRAMSHEKITSIFFNKKIKQTKIADELGISQSAVSQTISGTQTSRRIQDAICKATGIKWEDMWSLN